MFLRELCKNLAHDSGFWFMDLGGNWYKDAEVMAYVQKLSGLMKTVCKKEHRSVANVLAIVDEKSILQSPPARNGRMEHLWRNLNLCGTPCDLILSQDLARTDLSKVELAVLLTPYAQDAKYVENLHRLLPNGAKVLFAGESAALPGVSYTQSPDDNFIDLRLPPQQGISPLCRDYKGVCTAGVLENGDLLAASLCLDVNAVDKLLAHANVTRVAPTECCVYMDNRIVGFFPREDVCFVPQLEKGIRLFDAFTGEEHPKGAPLCIKAREARAFLIQK